MSIFQGRRATSRPTVVYLTEIVIHDGRNGQFPVDLSNHFTRYQSLASDSDAFSLWRCITREPLTRDQKKALYAARRRGEIMGWDSAAYDYSQQEEEQ